MRCLWLVVMLLTGCSPATRPTPVIESAGPVSTGPSIADRDYAFWQSFPVGTSIVRTAVTQSNDGTATSVERLTLIEKTDDKLIIERQNTTSRSDGYKVVNPPDLRTHPKSFTCPNGMKPDDFAKPSLKAMSKGTETIDGPGRRIECQVWMWTDSTESGPMTVTLWESKDVPGGRVKQSMKVDAKSIETIETFTSIEIPDKPR